MKFFLILIITLLNRIIDLFYYALGYKKVNSIDKINSILFFKVGSMGDNIITLPIIASIKDMYPNIEITYLTTSGKSPVSMENLIDKSYIKEFINYTDKNKKELLHSLKDKQYDLIIDLTQPSSLIRTIRNMIIFRYLGINKGIGWNISELSFFRKYQDDYDMVGSELEKYLTLICKYNVIPKKKFILGITDNEELKIDNLLEQYDLQDKRMIAFVLGSKRTTNRWPIEYFDEVIKFVINQTNYTPIIIGGEEDNILVDKLNQNLLSFCGKLTPLESAELFKRCKLTISNDTGPMHLSYAVGTKVITVFSARDFRNKWYPPENLGIVLRDDKIDCRLCYREKCSHIACLYSIKSGLVIDKLKKGSLL